MRTAGNLLEIPYESAHGPVYTRAWTFSGIGRRILMRLRDRLLKTVTREGATDVFLFLLTFLLAGWLCLSLYAPFSRCEAPAPQTPGHAAVMMHCTQTG
jgi:hypothetical protein